MALEIKHLTKAYRRNGAVFTAVKDANLLVEKGDFINIIGKSGSGKSTLLNMIAGLTTPTNGSVVVNGEIIAAWDDQRASAYRNRTIGYIPQGQSVLANLTVLDNVRLPASLFREKGSYREDALVRLAQVGIVHLAESYPQELSGGELKRVAVARALINAPDFLIADEPTADLDTETTARIMALLKEISQTGTGVLVVTHELETLSYGTRTYQMQDGVLTEKTAQRSNPDDL